MTQQTFVFYGDGASHNKAAVSAIRGALVFGAVISLLAAGFIFLWPHVVLAVIAVVFALYILVRGVFRLVSGLFLSVLSPTGRVVSTLLGIFLLIAGGVLLTHLGAGVAVLGIIIGLSWLIDGIALILESGRGSNRGIGITSGIISIVAGAVVLFVPALSVQVLTYLVGGILALLGILQIVGAFAVGRAKN